MLTSKVSTEGTDETFFIVERELFHVDRLVELVATPALLPPQFTFEEPNQGGGQEDIGGGGVGRGGEGSGLGAGEVEGDGGRVGGLPTAARAPLQPLQASRELWAIPKGPLP